jgi:hypothetical protein
LGVNTRNLTGRSWRGTDGRQRQHRRPEEVRPLLVEVCSPRGSGSDVVQHSVERNARSLKARYQVTNPAPSAPEFSRGRASGKGRRNWSPAMRSLFSGDGPTQTTRHCSGRWLRNSSTSWSGSISAPNRTRTPDSERSIVDEFSITPPLPETVLSVTRITKGTRLLCRCF